jgi:hypothetical protein
MADYSKRHGKPTHLHGLFIVGQGFLYSNPFHAEAAAPEDYFHTYYTEDHPLLAFKTSLLQALARFPRPQPDWAPAIEQYFQHKPTWNFLKPQNYLPHPLTAAAELARPSSPGSSDSRDGTHHPAFLSFTPTAAPAADQATTGAVSLGLRSLAEELTYLL